MLFRSVRQLADSLDAIFEPLDDGFTIEVPLPNERFQSVSLVVRGGVLELRSSVTDVDRTAEATLDRWLEKPSALAPGNTMAFAGIANAADRAALIRYIVLESAPR